MHIVLHTAVNQPYQRVWQGFDQQLFLKLSPPFPPVRLLRFDGCRKGDVVQLELNLLLFRQRWDSLIIEQQSSTEEIYFIDEGQRLPFFLRYWHHRHRIIRRGTHSEIVDDITFRTPFLLCDYLFYPLLYLQFLYRKPIYRRMFF